MAFGYFMNMEKLTLQIIDKHIANMTNNNYDEPYSLDEEIFLNNIENGFVVITNLGCYFESFLNTIINSCMEYKGDTLLKCSIEEKIDLIFMHYNKNWDNIKSRNEWEVYRKTTTVRNEMIHFKRTYVETATLVPDFNLGKQYVGKFFTKSNLQNVKEKYIKLVKMIANTLELQIFDNVKIIECAARDGLVNYVYDEKIIDVDITRFSKRLNEKSE